MIFSQLDKIIGKCSDAGMDIVLGTATARNASLDVYTLPGGCQGRF